MSNLKPSCIPVRIQSQQGAALILFFMLILLTGTVFFVSNISKDNTLIGNEAKTTRALAAAKEALIAYAITFDLNVTTGNEPRDGLMGFLPCPEWTSSLSEGQSPVVCRSQYESFLGRLPWKALDIEPLKDASGTCLWYAVSSEFKNGGNGIYDPRALPLSSNLSRTDMLNADSNGSFELYDRSGTKIKGNSAADRPVAVIIAPGKPLPGQARFFNANTQCGDDFVSSHFMENFNGIDNRSITQAIDVIDQFITSDRSSDNTFNDRIITISQQDIFNAIQKRSDFINLMDNTTHELAECVAEFGKSNLLVNDFRLPWPAAIGLAGNDYRDSRQYIENPGIHLGRFPVDVSATDAALNNQGGNFLLENNYIAVNALYTHCRDLNTDAAGTFNNVERRIWQNWKDHFFYALGNDFDANATTPTPDPCTNCLSVNGAGNYAAIVFFSGARLNGQSRNTIPDPDEKNNINNYLEGANRVDDGAYQTGGVTPAFNDIAYCINADMTVALCP